MLGGIHLTAPPHKADVAAHDPTQSVVGTGQDEQVKLSENTVSPSATDEDALSLTSTGHSATKFTIDPVKGRADAFPPLKSVMGILSAILDHCDVRLSLTPPTHDAHRCSSKR